MTAPPPVAYDVRWRPAGDEVTPWITRRFPVTEGITLRDLQRGVEHDIEVRAIAANGRSSEWVAATVTVASSARLGALALPVNVIANRASMWNVDTSVTYAAESPVSGDATATISVSAGTLVIGGRTIAYSASSATVTGTPGTSRIVYLYYDDPRFEGGSRMLGIADNVVASANAVGRVAIIALSIDFPAPGGSGGGGGGIGGGGGGGGTGREIIMTP